MVDIEQADHDLKLTTGDNNLEQLIVDPTRITNNSKSLIDLLFATNPRCFSGAGSVGFTGNDHLMIYGERKEKITVKTKTIVVPLQKMLDFCVISFKETHLETYLQVSNQNSVQDM